MSFLRSAWYTTMWGQDLAPGKLESRIIVGQPLVLIRDEEGVARALSGICPHRFAPLHFGNVKADGTLQCAYHGLEFDREGNCVRNPHGEGRAPTGCRLRLFPIIEKDTILWVWMGEDAADRSKLPDYGFLTRAAPGDEIRVQSKRDWLSMDANYRLVIANLLDLSHVPYLHDGLSGNATQVAALKYNRALMQAVLWDRIRIAETVGVEVISMDDAPKGYEAFDQGAPKKFVIDPHKLIPAAV